MVTKDSAYILRLPFIIKNHHSARQRTYTRSRRPHTHTHTLIHWFARTQTHAVAAHDVLRKSHDARTFTANGGTRARQRGRKPAHRLRRVSCESKYIGFVSVQRFRSRPETSISFRQHMHKRPCTDSLSAHNCHSGRRMYADRRSSKLNCYYYYYYF